MHCPQPGLKTGRHDPESTPEWDANPLHRPRTQCIAPSQGSNLEQDGMIQSPLHWPLGHRASRAPLLVIEAVANDL